MCIKTLISSAFPDPIYGVDHVVVYFQLSQDYVFHEKTCQESDSRTTFFVTKTQTVTLPFALLYEVCQCLGAC